MRNNVERDNYIYTLWDNGCSYTEISEMDLPSYLSLSRIRVIVYGGPDRLHNEFEKKVYHDFRLKYLELQNVHLSILYVWENQPPHRLSVNSIRSIINQKLRETSKTRCL